MEILAKIFPWNVLLRSAECQGVISVICQELCFDIVCARRKFIIRITCSARSAAKILTRVNQLAELLVVEKVRERKKKLFSPSVGISMSCKGISSYSRENWKSRNYAELALQGQLRFIRRDRESEWRERETLWWSAATVDDKPIKCQQNTNLPNDWRCRWHSRENLWLIVKWPLISTHKYHLAGISHRKCRDLMCARDSFSRWFFPIGNTAKSVVGLADIYSSAALNCIFIESTILRWFPVCVQKSNK